MILSLQKDSKRTLHQQICTQIREQIRSGRLPPGLKMPSTRTLVKDYSVSRNVFLAAFEQLQAEGYLISRKGSGTYVSDKIDPSLFPDPPENRNVKKHIETNRVLYDFSVSIPDLSHFPLREWGSCVRRAVTELKADEMIYGNNGGTRRLKRALRQHLLISRGMNIREEQLFICSGSHQALLLALQSCLDKSEKKGVVIENPAYSALTQSMLQCGAEIKAVETDEEGIIPEQIPTDDDTALISLTPSHLFPFGHVLPIHRRLELCRLAEELDCFILENEFEGDLRLKGTPVPSMHFLKEERIFTTGTFSQIMYPAMRLGYLIVPEQMISRVALWYRILGYGVSAAQQNGLAVFMEEGLLLRHYRKMRRHYQYKQELLIRALRKEFGNELQLSGCDTGTTLCASLAGVVFCDDLAERIQTGGLLADFEYRHYWPRGSMTGAPGMMMGFGNISPESMEAGVKYLGSIPDLSSQRRRESP